ncbi:putative tocopherol cyclase [Helianthus annuus]|uniref:Tocopherol cyclase n=1 Tax=Helianthus annuus TaxID=4232 RepID=Q2XV80_HELAN|nr:tocopherol cyclase, chloroplastic [Helianthus annuus]ABB52812.1 tocopherol cyclase [Helianthus annuus]ABB52814.1 tocopherol cyclase [Helianthus annuus]ABB52815.1 tocopherol cyclase [Helianthus annuus]ABB52816.1 tocopherol cyclase [Helianthus annuus]KAJ0540278.1 putative tocopherol cyclase [Helianthus annuus]
MELQTTTTSPLFSSLLASSKPNNVKSSVRLKLERNRRLSAAKTDVYGVELQSQEIVNPVYVPTPTNRPLRPPHSGYHFDGTTRKFFEGWYFKVSIPEQRQSFCFMYSVENPAFKKDLNILEQLQHGPRFTGVGAQILGAHDKYICQYSKESHNFWGSRHELMLGNSFSVQTGKQPPNSEVPPQVFNQRVIEGFQVTPLWHQGFIRDDGRTSYAETVKTARWEYSTRPVYGWGDVGSKQKSTAGWLAAFPVFEPHWQICMAGGLSTGWIEWGDERYEFENAPSYCEKNWGGGFPRKWFWVQCNVFKGASGEVGLTCGGGLRQLPGLNETFENAALIGVHHGGIFYEFVPWNGVVEWEVAEWGYWHVTAQNETHKVELEASTKDPGTTLRAPTTEAGLAPACKDTCFAHLTLKLWEKGSAAAAADGKLILDVTSNMAAVEVGGGPWFNTWKGKTYTPEVINRALNLPVDVDGILGSFPLLKPPGL